MKYVILYKVERKYGDMMSKKEASIKRGFFKFIIYFIVKIRDDDIFALAAQLAYYLILSFFPFLIFLLTLIGFSNLDSMEVLGALRAMLPTSAFELIYSVIIEVIEKQNTGLLGASLLLVIWSASSAFRAVIKGINKVLQSAGRVIRTENDKGRILLIDRRYKDYKYKFILPKEWDIKEFIFNCKKY